MDDRTEAQNRAVFAGRLAIGLVQGLALYFLNLAFTDKTWPATDGFLYAPLLFVSLYVPLIVSIGIGNLRAATLVTWTLAASALVAAAAWYAIWQWPVEWAGIDDHPRIVPEFALFFFTLVGLYIAHVLISAADSERRWLAQYPAYFDCAWKFLLQGVLSACFVGVFWGVLELGAALFSIIGLDGFRTFIEHRWFAVPATTLAFAAALHVTDVRVGLIRGVRSLGLALLSWLLPLMAALAAAFLVGLVFTGLKPLWDTRFAAGDLLTASAVLVILINAAFQDGSQEHRPAAVLRISGSLAALLLMPLVALSAYAVALRVGQYGWTTDRVNSVGCLVVAGFLAIGYALAAIPMGPWLGRLARLNILAAFLGLLVIIALFSPIADPMRIAVDSQMARLAKGSVKAEAFDYGYLRWRSGRFGLDALHRLEHWEGPQASYVRDKAHAILNYHVMAYTAPIAQDLADNFIVYPAGRKLPSAFLHQDWLHDPDASSLPACLTTAGVGCQAFFLDLAGDGHEEIVVIGTDKSGTITGSNGVFAEDEKGVWHLTGRPNELWQCPVVLKALKRGDFSLAPPLTAAREVDVHGTHLTIDRLSQACPN
ncbi:MAG TPA: DUF4153 domain-containing protein [Rhizomicrobium sp.]|nr:DUF4153 domain-containing protein [Rhizomicrobium sp.]